LSVQGYALAWFLVTDPVKLLAYRIFDPAKAGIGLAKPKTLTDLTPQITTRT
jgi:H+-transporting ATPase